MKRYFATIALLLLSATPALAFVGSGSNLLATDNSATDAQCSSTNNLIVEYLSTDHSSNGFIGYLFCDPGQGQTWNDAGINSGNFPPGNPVDIDIIEQTSATCVGNPNLNYDDCFASGHISTANNLHVYDTIIPTPAHRFLDINGEAMVASISLTGAGIWHDFGDGGVIEIIIGLSVGLMTISWAINKFRRRH